MFTFQPCSISCRIINQWQEEIISTALSMDPLHEKLTNLKLFPVWYFYYIFCLILSVSFLTFHSQIFLLELFRIVKFFSTPRCYVMRRNITVTATMTLWRISSMWRCPTTSSAGRCTCRITTAATRSSCRSWRTSATSRSPSGRVCSKFALKVFFNYIKLAISERFDEMRSIQQSYYILVISRKSDNKIVAGATLVWCFVAWL